MARAKSIRLELLLILLENTTALLHGARRLHSDQKVCSRRPAKPKAAGDNYTSWLGFNCPGKHRAR